MKKTFVLDTNVILFDAFSLLKFSQNKICIPFIVIEELDRFKKEQSENGRNAREFSRLIDGLRVQAPLSKGVSLESGGMFFVTLPREIPEQTISGVDLSQNDNAILATCLELKKKGEQVILVTKDINMRLKADVLGISAEDYGKKNLSVDDLYNPLRMLEIAREKLLSFEKEGIYKLSAKEAEGTYPNEFLYLSEQGNTGYRHLARYDRKRDLLVTLKKERAGVWGVHPKNHEQQCAIDALMNDDIKLVILIGKAGTGKTLMAIAAGLEKTLNAEIYNRMLVSRPVWPLGRDLGFLPGDIEEKLSPWMRPIHDNLDYLFDDYKTHRQKKGWSDLVEEGLLQVEPLTYIRGRTLPRQYMIVDEAQNLTPHEMKTIITRAGVGTKIVLTGDCEQIDNPYLDSVNNGLAFCLERFKAQDLGASVILRTGERSALSELAAELL